MNIRLLCYQRNGKAWEHFLKIDILIMVLPLKKKETTVIQEGIQYLLLVYLPLTTDNFMQDVYTDTSQSFCLKIQLQLDVIVLFLYILYPELKNTDSTYTEIMMEFLHERLFQCLCDRTMLVYLRTLKTHHID